MFPNFLSLLLVLLVPTVSSAQWSKLAETSSAKVAKLYGAGGVGRIEAYGTGVIVSPEGHVLTLLTPLLEAEKIGVVISDGRRYDGKLIGFDTSRELAMVKINAMNLPSFDLADVAQVEPGMSVLALSNQFQIAAGNEPVSVTQGVVSAVTTLSARQGYHQFTFPGKVYVIDANTNNPGAAGGAVVDRRGRLVGLIGKEVRNSLTETWLNYALPIVDLREIAQEMMTGAYREMEMKKSVAAPPVMATLKADLRGLVLLPDVLDRTPAYVESIRPGSPAASTDLAVNDLILFVDQTLIQSASDLRTAFAGTPPTAVIKLTLLRGEELHTVDVPARPTPKENK